MKTAQELRAGNVIMVGSDPLVVVKAEYTKSGRSTAVVKMKFKNLLTDTPSETIYGAGDKFEVVILEKKEATYSYFADPMYICMDEEFNQYEVEAENEAEAEELGWHYEDHAYSGEVYSIKVDEQEEDEQEEEDQRKPKNVHN